MWNANSFISPVSSLDMVPLDHPSVTGFDSKQLKLADGQTSPLTFAIAQYVPQSHTQFASAAHNLIERILHLESFDLELNMINFLNTEGVLPILLSYMIRIPNNQPPIPLDSTWELDPRIHRVRDLDLASTISSWRVMEILTSTNPLNSKFIDQNVDLLLRLLFDMLALNSDGNLYHFASVLNNLMNKTNPVLPISDLLLTVPPNYSPVTESGVPLFPYLLRLLRYIYIPAIFTVIVQCLIQAKLGNSQRTELFVKLQEVQFIEFLLTSVQSDYSPLVLSTKDLFNFLVEEILRLEGGEILVMSLTTDQHILKQLITLLDSSHVFHHNTVISILYALVVKSLPRPLSRVASSFSKSPPPPILSKSISVALIPHAPKLVQFLDTSRTSSIQLECMELLQAIIYECTVDQLITEFDPKLWHTLSDIALVHHPTSPFLTCYYRILHNVVNRNSSDLITNALVTPHLVPRLIYYYLYSDTEPGANENLMLSKWNSYTGYSGSNVHHGLVPKPCHNFSRSDLHASVILVLNLFRLAADCPGHCLNSVLANLAEYQHFVPILRTRTESQILTPAMKELFANIDIQEWRPIPQYSPIPVKVDFVDLESTSFHWHSSITSRSKKANPIVKLTKEQEFGIDLGSKFAICLGFEPSLETGPAVSDQNLNKQLDSTDQLQMTNPPLVSAHVYTASASESVIHLASQSLCDVSAPTGFSTYENSDEPLDL